MMNSQDIISLSIDQISKGLQLELQHKPKLKDEGDPEKILLAWLTPIIKHLLDTNLERLLHLLYRIDVSELKVKKTLLEASPDEIASSLSILIIQRQLQKIALREKYKGFS